jgi:hypothetical protein
MGGEWDSTIFTSIVHGKAAVLHLSRIVPLLPDDPSSSFFHPLVILVIAYLRVDTGSSLTARINPPSFPPLGDISSSYKRMIHRIREAAGAARDFCCCLKRSHFCSRWHTLCPRDDTYSENFPWAFAYFMDKRRYVYLSSLHIVSADAQGCASMRIFSLAIFFQCFSEFYLRWQYQWISEILGLYDDCCNTNINGPTFKKSAL